MNLGPAGPWVWLAGAMGEDPDFDLKPGEYVMKATGQIRGLSLSDNPGKLEKNGLCGV
jgi:hypothetical protein